MTNKRFVLPAIFLLFLLASAFAKGAFSHPGLLHSREDLERMRKMVSEGAEPYKSGFEVFKADPASRLDYRMRGPAAEIGRNPNIHSAQFDSDANAAYQLALMWAITREKAYADKATEILNAWSGSLKCVSGRDAVLMAGLGPFKMLNAAEILRYTNAGWSPADIARCEQMFLNVIYPVVKDFAPFANGNWDAAAVQTVLAIGVFCENRAIFEHGLRYYVDGPGNGCLLHYVINETGQCQESGRDQQHTQLGLALLAASCEVAWQQGLDLYAYADYRLLKGFEYTAQYNLGNEVPFVETLDRTGKYPHKQISPKGRGRFRAVFEMVYNHYVNRAGISAPYTQKVVEKIRPEGPGLPGADHPGFGTLLFYRPQERPTIQDVPAAPGGLVAERSSGQITLTWIASVGATSYVVKRSKAFNGPYEIIADTVQSSCYEDRTIQPGCLYYYTISAVNQQGCSLDAYPVGICSGLPKEWQETDIGPASIPGSTVFDGQMFSIETSGTSLDSKNAAFHFTYIPLEKDSVLTARYVPPLNSQFTWFGLMMRRSLDSRESYLLLQIMPQFGRDIEAPGWSARLLTRREKGAKENVESMVKLESPYSRYGRLNGYCWLQLRYIDGTFTALISPDGKMWTPVGRSSVKLGPNLLAGLAVSSGIKNKTTTVCFDHVKVEGLSAFLKQSEKDFIGIRNKVWEKGNVSLSFPFNETSDAELRTNEVDYVLYSSEKN